jgi:hypothetical protein
MFDVHRARADKEGISRELAKNLNFMTLYAGQGDIMKDFYTLAEVAKYLEQPLFKNKEGVRYELHLFGNKGVDLVKVEPSILEGVKQVYKLGSAEWSAKAETIVTSWQFPRKALEALADETGTTI